MNEKRFYRDYIKAEGLTSFQAKVEQTDLFICATKNLRNQSIQYIKSLRSLIEGYIKNNPDFLHSLKPIEYEIYAPNIIKKMCDASYKAGTGPMASIAGAFSQYVGNELLKFSNEVIIENGGDIFIKSKLDRIMQIYSGNENFKHPLNILIKAEETPCGVCTSSGKIGHSLSFGNADAVVIRSKDCILADAVATATGNMVKYESDIEKAVEFAYNIKDVDGALVIIDKKMAAIGNIEIAK